MLYPYRFVWSIAIIVMQLKFHMLMLKSDVVNAEVTPNTPKSFAKISVASIIHFNCYFLPASPSNNMVTTTLLLHNSARVCSGLSLLFSLYCVSREWMAIGPGASLESRFVPPSQLPTSNMNDTSVSLLPSITLTTTTTQEPPPSPTTDPRSCSSPEYNVTWPLPGSAVSATSSLTCGINSDSSAFSNYFKQLASSLEARFKHPCTHSIKFGVAFGKSYLGTMQQTKYNPRSCSVMFVLEDDMPTLDVGKKSFKMENLIGIPRNVLPYKNMRRNVKLFKLNGHLLFPFAKAVVWQDAKLQYLTSHKASYYADKFLASTNEDSSRPCLVAMGIPIHYNAFGDGARIVETYHPKYHDHCDTVVKAIQDRPTVTDSTETLLQQCRFYQGLNASMSGDTVMLHRGLIDSAFMVWNQSEKCRDFNSKLACTWSDEIQCFSDRDQISFPRVLQQMGLREIGESKPNQGSDTSISLVNDSNELMVRIIGSSCHWYYEKFPQSCIV